MLGLPWNGQQFTAPKGASTLQGAPYSPRDRRGFLLGAGFRGENAPCWLPGEVRACRPVTAWIWDIPGVPKSACWALRHGKVGDMSTPWPQGISPVNVLEKLRRNLKAVDTQPMVVSLQRPGSGTPWTVQKRSCFPAGLEGNSIRGFTIRASCQLPAQSLHFPLRHGWHTGVQVGEKLAVAPGAGQGGGNSRPQPQAARLRRRQDRL